MGAVDGPAAATIGVPPLQHRRGAHVGNLGFAELAIVAVIALVVFGPERLPELARRAGRGLARFREETSRSVEELKQAADIEDLDRELKGLSADMRQVRSSMSEALTAPTGSTPRPEDRPPPTDPEAT